MEQQQLQQAAEIFEQLSALLPNDPISIEKLAWIAIKLQNFTQAIALYAQLLRIQPGDTNIQRRLAALYFKAGDPQKSRACLLKSRAVN